VASRWRTGRQSQGLWLMNCCSACSLPSGSDLFPTSR
jgi:hypothetical protein